VFAASRYHWVERRHPLQWLSDLWDLFRLWVSRLNDAHPSVSWAFFWLALVLLVILLVHLLFTLWTVYRSTVRPADLPGRVGVSLELLDARSHRVRAEALARDGRYEEALAHRFAALVCDLGEAKAVSIHHSKTPAEYAREARVDATGKMTLGGLVSTLYLHLFGGAPIDERGYRDFVANTELVLPHVGSR